MKRKMMRGDAWRRWEQKDGVTPVFDDDFRAATLLLLVKTTSAVWDSGDSGGGSIGNDISGSASDTVIVWRFSSRELLFKFDKKDGLLFTRWQWWRQIQTDEEEDKELRLPSLSLDVIHWRLTEVDWRPLVNCVLCLFLPTTFSLSYFGEDKMIINVSHMKRTNEVKVKQYSPALKPRLKVRRRLCLFLNILLLLLLMMML